MVILVNGRFLIPGKLEGIGLYTFEITRRLAAMHPEHHFIVCIDRKSSMQLDLGPNVEYDHILPPARHPLLFLWWFEVGISKAYQRHHADLFFSPDGFCSLNSKISNTLLVIHDLAYLHYPEQVGFLMRWYYRFFVPRFIKKATRIITVSNATRSDLINHFSPYESKVSVIYNGVRSANKIGKNTSRKWRIALEDRPYFIVLGSIHPRKNLSNVLRAFTHFKNEVSDDTCLLIVGRMAWKTTQIKALFEKHPYRDSILFTGYLDDLEMFKAMKGSLGLVYVSLFEGFGLPLVEAMANGIPIITSDRSSMPEIVGKAGLLVNPDQPQSIAQGMVRVRFEKQLTSDLIEKGLTRAQFFSWDRAAEETWKLMQKSTAEI